MPICLFDDEDNHFHKYDHSGMIFFYCLAFLKIGKSKDFFKFNITFFGHTLHEVIDKRKMKSGQLPNLMLWNHKYRENEVFMVLIPDYVHEGLG
jgi:hypothetical protein